ncbi:hypothetical protein B0T09DRAFT_349222, partial [Sordaria sp. MPI-SDFR-AT-0083]
MINCLYSAFCVALLPPRTASRCSSLSDDHDELCASFLPHVLSVVRAFTRLRWTYSIAWVLREICPMYGSCQAKLGRESD